MPAAPDPAPPAGGMPAWIPRATLVVLALVTCWMAVLWGFERLRGLIFDIVVALFLALAFEPAVGWLARRGVRRGAGTAAVFVVVLALAGGFLALLGSLIVDQVVEFAQHVPGYVEDLIRWINRTFDTDLTLDKIQGGLFKDSGSVTAWAQRIADNAIGVSAAIVGGLFRLFTIALFAFYFTADGPRLRRAVCSLFPPDRQQEVLRAWELAIGKTGGYLYSRGIMAVVSAAAHYAVLRVLHVPFALVLAIWIGLVSQFIPTVGTYLAIVLPALIALTSGVLDMLWLIAFATVYQQFENYLLAPRVTAATVDVHPAVAFGSVIAGTALMGPVGAFVAIPATATATAFLAVYVRRYDVPEHPLTPEGEAAARRGRPTWRARLRGLFLREPGDFGNGDSGNGDQSQKRKR